MALEVSLFVVLSCACLFTASTPVHRRQTSAVTLAEYITQVKTAIYVIDSIKANNASSSCADSGLSTTLQSDGYDGQYAQQLLYAPKLVACDGGSGAKRQIGKCVE